MTRILLLAILPLLLASTFAMAQDVGARLKDHLAAHPRLMFDKAACDAFLAATKDDARLAKLRQRVIEEADSTLALKPLTRTLVGRRLLSTSREALSRIATEAMAYRFTGDRKYFEAARANMLAACGFEDFNPTHFLDTAEMTAALGIGYDWLYAELSAEDRATIRKTILEKGIAPSFTDPAPWWAAGGNNWNQVCNAGLSIGALAVAEDAPAETKKTVERALAGLPVVMKHYAPDGGYPEGAMYWAYGTTYNVMGIAALQTALGDDFGLLEQPGFLKTADYRLHITGPSGFCFSYSDSTEDATQSPAAAQFFLARARNDPSLLYNDLRSLDALLAQPVGPKDYHLGHWMLLMWMQKGLDVVAPKSTYYAAAGDTPVAMHRSGWDKDATFVAINGGSPSTSHGHMDIGGFALDAGGVRWAMDLGYQSYNSLEKVNVKLWDSAQGSQRWQVYRISPMSHNILTVNGQEQTVRGRATFEKTTPQFTIVDLAPVYEGQFSAAKRGVTLREDKSVRVQDEITAAVQPATQPSTQPAKPTVVRWAMTTRAEVDGQHAPAAPNVVSLRQGDKSLQMRIVSPKAAKWQVTSTEPPHDYDEKNPGTRQLTFEVTVEPGQSETIVVDFVPGPAATESPAVKAVKEW